LDGQPSDFFFLSGLQKLEQGAKKCTELLWEYVEQIPSLVAVACFLSGRAKDLSGPPRSSLSTADIKALNVSTIDDLWHFSNISYVLKFMPVSAQD